jgi:TonB-dependent SusC/RagA subfamily outer membrane receptor
MKLDFFDKLSRKTILIFVFLLLLSGFPSIYANQTLKVTGEVTDSRDGSTLIGVNVTVKGTTIGTITDIDGKYRIDVSGNEAVLIFSFIGYKSTEVVVNGQAVINVALSSENKILDEVVITALGIQKDKAKVGYAIQDIKGEELIKAREPNPVNSLAGKFAGLTVGASAELLGSPSVFLRGKTPIFVVDGVPIQSDTWNISPDDIDSYTVLKGPAASALYGSRGQFGAIMITTKRGSKDKRGFAVEFNSSSMIEKGFIAIPKVQDEYGPGDHGVYAFGNGRGGGLNDGDYDVWGPKFEGQLIPQYDSPVVPGATFNTTFPNGTKYSSNREPTPYIGRGKDNLKRFLENGFLSTNNLTVSSSNDKYDLRFSATHTYQKGIVPNTKLNSTNFNVSAGYNFSKKLRFESNVNFNRQYTPNIPDVEYGPNSIIYNIILWGGADWDIDDMKNYWEEGKEGIQSIYAEYQRYHNPYFMSYEWLRGHYKTDLYGYTSLEWTIGNYLDLSA